MDRSSKATERLNRRAWTDAVRQVWRREGLVLPTRPDHPLLTRTYVPTVLPLTDTLWRIFFAGWDKDRRSRILAIDVDPTRSMQVVAEHFSPLFDLGPLGAFDYSGTVPSCAIRVGSQVWLYYFGVHLRHEVRATAAIGRAVSDDGLHFHRTHAGPVVGTGPLDPFLTGSMYVKGDATGYRMWYASGTTWGQVQSDAQPDPTCGLRLTRSPDGCFWSTQSHSVIDPAEPAEVGLARPWIVSLRERDHLYYSRRGSDYREGGQSPYSMAVAPLDPATGLLAGSAVPLEFENRPQAGDFDSWMQAYGCVLPSGADLIMVYNGNGFGRTGIGWARLPGGAAR